MIDEFGKIACFMMEGVEPYVKDKKTLENAIDNWNKRFLGDGAYDEDVDEFDKARDIFDNKLGLLRSFVLTKKIDKEDKYEILIDYIKEAVDEFEKACEKRGN